VPTGAEYRAAATRFRSAADDVVIHLGAQLAPGGATFVAPGPIRSPIDVSLAAVVGELGRAAASLAELASVCDGRASVCDAYRDAYLVYRSLDPLQQLLTEPPPRPAGWAEL
jgi:hypothetical protein